MHTPTRTQHTRIVVQPSPPSRVHGLSNRTYLSLSPSLSAARRACGRDSRSLVGDYGRRVLGPPAAPTRGIRVGRPELALAPSIVTCQSREEDATEAEGLVIYQSSMHREAPDVCTSMYVLMCVMYRVEYNSTTHTYIMY